MRVLIAIPVYNEAKTVRGVLERVHAIHPDILVIDDGSTDETAAIINELKAPMGLDLIRHEANAGYGRAIRESFQRAARGGYDWVITMDCDEQHEPARIPDFLRAIERDDLDIVSGSRYMSADAPTHTAPSDRRSINRTITQEINATLGFELTDAFCGFKAHRVDAMSSLSLSEDGYAFPMQLWVQAANQDMRVGEIEVELIYNDPNRTFGGGLDDAAVRLAHYRDVMGAELTKLGMTRAHSAACHDD
jgi:glycosyltransferase involved in cell wall biosynthesis